MGTVQLNHKFMLKDLKMSICGNVDLWTLVRDVGHVVDGLKASEHAFHR